MRISKFNILAFLFAITLIGISGSKAFGQTVNLVTDTKVGATASQSSVFEYQKKTFPPSNAIDGKSDGTSDNLAETNPPDKDKDAWFELDLKKNYKINKIVLYPRTAADCCDNQFYSFWLIVTDQKLVNKPMVDKTRIAASSTYSLFTEKPINNRVEINLGEVVGQYVRLQTLGARIELKEIEVWGNSTAVTNHVSNTLAWDTDVNTAFDPNYPKFRAPEETDDRFHHFNTIENSPKIVGVKNSNNSFDIAFQLSGNSKTIKINNYVKDGAGFKKTANSKSVEGLGMFGGFTKDAAGNRYIFTGTRSTYSTDAQGNGVWSAEASKVYKNEDVDKPLWQGKFSEGGTIGDVKAFMHFGGSRLVIGKDSLLITANFAPAHPYQVILDTKDPANNMGRAFYESRFQHNFGQRAIFDGTDFVVMEDRDHDVSVTLSKINPSEKFPLIPEATTANLTNAQKENDHANEYIKRIFSIYSHSNFRNSTFLELGNVEKGLNDNGYLVLFASERDWSEKLKDFNSGNEQPKILSPRDIGLVHVRKDFNVGSKVNWLDKKGNYSQCPITVDNSNFVNSIANTKGEPTKTVNYKAANDGWDWKNYSPGCYKQIVDKEAADRSLVTSGVNWITQFGAGYSSKATGEFTSVNHPKLVYIGQNKYIALWEEWKAAPVSSTNKYGDPKKEYLTTKAVLITLSANGTNVNIVASAPADLGKYHLMPGDDAFEFGGKAAWATGNVNGKLMFYTVGENLVLNKYELEL